MILYISNHNVVQLVNFPSQGIFSLLVTKVQDGRVDRVLITRDATAISSQGIISCFLDTLDIVQILADFGILG